MSFITERYEMLRLKRTAIDRYALQSLLDYRLSDDPAQRRNWVRAAAENINIVRASGHDGLPPVSSGTINGMVLLSEAYLRVMNAYARNVDKQFIEHTLEQLDIQSDAAFAHVFTAYLDGFPTRRIYHRAIDTNEYLNGETAGMQNRHKTLETMTVSWLHQMNPALGCYRELFDPGYLNAHCDWERFFRKLDTAWSDMPSMPNSSDTLLNMLRKPAIEAPDSIEDQLRYVASRWREYLGDFTDLILTAADTIREETRPVFGGPGPSHVPEYRDIDAEPEAFSRDENWMPNVVLLAKNTYVWLEQLSREYGRRIDTLDQIPQDALDRIASRGFNALWLIGLWSRSHASRRIKQICGNPEAAASAYAIYDYRIDDDLGGDPAFDVLKHRAARAGIRMAGDMVPNHMGIDSWWVCEHPEWFISTEENPFHRYAYSGVDLSGDPKCSIYLEDHYYEKTDAAVTFKYIDHWNGKTAYIYHGNDGTDLPWNDTAQLNFLRKDVRDQVIQTIVNVARRFPIIRFDAAMTLAKKHYHRLWFPAPGHGGDIPSRSRFSMSREAFDDAMPMEFWREVVDRVAAEVPDTLLLAEAFWLMEGYFVRSLGMHRVYNSAFMNMLRDEDNQKYRQVIKNTIEFDREILKRYVNFMNNPDEEPAANQFGRGEKYFGVCAMMCTLPGLPMFGHGQFEGYAEKYGMEYRRSYWDESVDHGLLTHHERVITPILRRRSVFSGADGFRLFDFYRHSGDVDENVFAYSNRNDSGSGLFLFNNSPHATAGTLHKSAAWNPKTDDGQDRVQENIGESLGLSGGSNHYVCFHDLMARRWIIRNSRVLRDSGFFIELPPYGCCVFVDIVEMIDTEDGKYRQLSVHLSGRGCRNIESAWLDLQNQAVHDAFRRLFDSRLLEDFDAMTRIESGSGSAGESPSEPIDLDAFAKKIEPFFAVPTNQLKAFEDVTAAAFTEAFLDILEKYLPGSDIIRRNHPDKTRLLMIWTTLLMRSAASMLPENDETVSNGRLWRLLEDQLRDAGMQEDIATAAARLTQKIALNEFDDVSSVSAVVSSDDGKRWIQAHKYRGSIYFNKESFEEMLDWINLWSDMNPGKLRSIADAAESAGYRLEEFLDALHSDQ